MKKLILLIVFISLSGASPAAETAVPAVNPTPASTPAGASTENSKQPRFVDSDTLEVYQDEQKAVFSGHVVTTQGTSVIKSDRMIIYYLSKEDMVATAGATPAPITPKNPKDKTSTPGGKKSIKRIDFEGNVFLTNPEEAARSLKGSYDPQKNFVTLTSDVVLIKDNNILKGSQLDYNMDTGYSKLYSQPAPGVTPTRVRGLFIPNADDQPTSN